jgi:hypothetical protein
MKFALIFWAISCAVGCTCAEPRTDVPSYRAPHVDAPRIDGRLNDRAWSIAPSTERFVATMDGSLQDPEATARIAWDDEHLFIAFDVADDFLKSDLSGDDPHLWEQDCVEVMLDPGGDGRDYFEIQLSPSEEIFDTRFDTRRLPQPFGRVSWASEMDGATEVHGTLNDEASDEGYTAELRIPWRAFSPNERPNDGDEWRIALYVLDARPTDQRGVGWSPPLIGDYHVPNRFGRVAFIRE